MQSPPRRRDCYDLPVMKPLPIVIAPLLFAVAVVAATPKSNSASPSANATTQELPLPQLKQSEREKYEKETLNGLPQLSPRKLSDLFELHVEHGDLVIKPTARPTERSRVQLDGFNGQSIIMIGADQANPNANKGADAATYVYLEHHDFAQPDEVYRSVQVMATGTTLQLAGDVSLPREGGRNVQLILNYANKDDPVEAAARLYVQVIAPVSEDVVTKIDLTGNNFADLRQRYPLETHTYVAPLVRLLHQESVLAPDPQQAAQVLGGGGGAGGTQADPQMVQ